jgi:hypothetical protein
MQEKARNMLPAVLNFYYFLRALQYGIYTWMERME